jgi:hypothetical protein
MRSRNDRCMLLNAHNTYAPFAMLLASFLMVVAGMAKKRLAQKVGICPVCHHERKACTCRWL